MKLRLSATICLFLFFPFTGNNSQSLSRDIPSFELEDQFGKLIRSKDTKGKRVLLVGCYPQDEGICRKVGRKIFWTLESLMMKEKVHIERIGYICLKNISTSRIDRILPRFQKDGFESVYLDKTGQLEPGLIKGKVYIRGYNSIGQLILEEYRDSIETDEVNKIFKIISN